MLVVALFCYLWVIEIYSKPTLLNPISDKNLNVNEDFEYEIFPSSYQHDSEENPFEITASSVGNSWVKIGREIPDKLSTSYGPKLKTYFSQIVGNTLYFLDSTMFRVYDIQDVSKPNSLGEYAIYDCSRFVVNFPYCYLQCSNKFLILNVSSVSNIDLIQTINVGWHIVPVDIVTNPSNTKLYTCTSSKYDHEQLGGVEAWWKHISDDNSVLWEFKGRINNKTCKMIKLRNEIIFLANGNNTVGGIEVYDFESPSGSNSIKRLAQGKFNNHPLIHSLELAQFGGNDYLFVGDETVHVYQINNLTKPVFIATYPDTYGSCERIIQIIYRNNMIYDHDGGKWEIRNITDITDGSRIFVSAAKHGVPSSSLKSISLDDKEIPELLVASGYTDGLNILDIGNKLDPKLIYEKNYVLTNPMNFQIVGDVAYVLNSGNGLFSLNITDYKNPVRMGRYLDELRYGCKNFVVRDGIAYIANVGYLLLVNVSAPEKMKFISTFNLGMDDVYGINVKGDIAYLSGKGSCTEGKLVFVNISKPLNLQIISSKVFTDVDCFGNINVVGNRAYVAAGISGMHIYNISNVSKLTLVGNYSGLNVYGGNVENEVYYPYGGQSSKLYGLHGISVSSADEKNPREVWSFDGIGNITYISVKGGFGAFGAFYDHRDFDRFYLGKIASGGYDDIYNVSSKYYDIGFTEIVKNDIFVLRPYCGVEIYHFGKIKIRGKTPGFCGDFVVEIDATDITGVEKDSFTVKVRKPGYFDPICEVWKCEGRYTNDTDICSKYGSCIFVNYGKDNYCKCLNGHLGDDCEIQKCFQFYSNETGKVCNNHGNCIWSDTQSKGVCECEGGYYGDECKLYNCFGIVFSDNRTCSGNGKCTDTSSTALGKEISITPRCICNADHYGPNCNITTCFGFWNNNTAVNSESICHGRGRCVKKDFCECYGNVRKPISPNCTCHTYYSGDYCNITKCGTYLYNDTNVCNKHGSCNIDTRTCNCDNANYTGEYCEKWNCYDFDRSNSKEVCGGHGACLDYNHCDCSSKIYGGDDCTVWSCFGTLQSESSVCAGHGSCVDQDKCWCYFGYSSLLDDWICTEWFCQRKHKNTTTGCSDRGKCISHNKCECETGYIGKFCDSWNCHGFDKKYITQSCSGNGNCLSPDECDCNIGFGGKECQTNIIAAAVLTPVLTIAAGGVGIVIFLFICLCCCCACCCCYCLCCACCCACCQFLRTRKYGKLKNFDILLKEQQLENDVSIAHLKMNKALFEVPFSEVKVNQMLGEGGSCAVVFKATWNHLDVAFKCFKTRQICTSQDKFDEFEREVEILASISHPAIIAFYGATVQSPRIGIIMEFAEHGDLAVFLRKYLIENRRMFLLSQKMRILREVVSAMDYLHSRNIIHRDLKLENVLLDKDMKAKLMDFGLSTIVDRMSQAKTTRIGTNLYMAPEVLNLNSYTEKCDVFSFGVFIFIFLTEIYEPYGEEKENVHIEVKVSSDPTFRPPVDKFDEIVPSSLNWLRELMIESWKHQPEDRKSFEDIGRVFDEMHNAKSEWVEYSNDSVNEQVCKWKRRKDVIFEDRKKFKVSEKEKQEVLKLEKEIEELKRNFEEEKKLLISEAEEEDEYAFEPNKY